VWLLHADCVCVCVCVLTHARNASIKLRASHWCAFVFIQGRSALLKEPILLSKKKKTHERSSSVSKSLKTMLGADCKLTHTRACACTSIASPLPPHLHHHCLLTCITIASSPALPLPPHLHHHYLLTCITIASSPASLLPPHLHHYCLLTCITIASSPASPLPPHLHHYCLLTCITIASSPASLLPPHLHHCCCGSLLHVCCPHHPAPPRCLH